MIIKTTELSKLNTLLEEGVIDQNEYDAKIASLISYKPNSNETSNNSSVVESKSKMSVIVICSIVAIVVGLIGYAIGSDNDASTYSTDEDSDYEIGYETRSENCLYAVEDFYLDSAVVCIEGDGTYYHRYGCPDTPMGDDSYDEYTYRVYNVEAAKGNGYIACPTCFGMEQYKYIEDYLY